MHADGAAISISHLKDPKRNQEIFINRKRNMKNATFSSLSWTAQETTPAHISYCTEALYVQENIRNKHKNLGYMNQTLKNFKSLILTNRPIFSIFLHVCLLLLQTD